MANKATIYHFLLKDIPQTYEYPPPDALFIQDGKVLFHTLEDIPPRCGEICLNILNQMISKKNFLFSTDCYHLESIKSQERMRRERSENIILGGAATRRPYDYKSFLANDDKKKQLSELLLKV